MYYTSGIFNDWSCDANAIDTFWTAVGYGKSQDSLYWIVQSNWGTAFGEQGFVRLERRDDKNTGICGITELAGLPIA